MAGRRPPVTPASSPHRSLVPHVHAGSCKPCKASSNRGLPLHYCTQLWFRVPVEQHQQIGEQRQLVSAVTCYSRPAFDRSTPFTEHFNCCSKTCLRIPVRGQHPTGLCLKKYWADGVATQAWLWPRLKRTPGTPFLVNGHEVLYYLFNLRCCSVRVQCRRQFWCHVQIKQLLPESGVITANGGEDMTFLATTDSTERKWGFFFFFIFQIRAESVSQPVPINQR